MSEKELVSKRIGQYVQIRDKLREMEEQHEANKKPLIETQNLLTTWLTKILDDAGAQSVKTEHGTVYKSVRYTASLEDAKAFMDYVIANNEFDLLDRRANATAVRAHVEEKGGLPPGAKLSALETIGVRRA